MGENFLKRWARRKAEYKNGDGKFDAGLQDDGQAPIPRSADRMPDSAADPLPTLGDVAQLSPDSDYSRFLSKGIDTSVRRAAFKKLFSDPHFNVMDGLDIYIDDYNKPSPLSAAMLAGLKHTQSLFEAVAKQEAERKEREALAAASEENAEPSRSALSEEDTEEVPPAATTGAESIEPALHTLQGAEYGTEHHNQSGYIQAAQGTS